MAGILEDYEKDIVQRVGLTLNDIMFLEPEEFCGEIRHRIPIERCAEIRGMLQLTSLKGLTAPTARVLYAAGVTTRWDLLNMTADEIVEKVNAATDKKWGDKEHRKMQKVLDDNADLLDEI
jgi:hypothetical protein